MRFSSSIIPLLLSVVFTFGAGFLFNFSWGNLLAGNNFLPLDLLNRYGGSNDYVMYLADIAFWFVAVRGVTSAFGRWGGFPQKNPQKKKSKKLQYSVVKK